MKNSIETASGKTVQTIRYFLKLLELDVCIGSWDLEFKMMSLRNVHFLIKANNCNVLFSKSYIFANQGDF